MAPTLMDLKSDRRHLHLLLLLDGQLRMEEVKRLLFQLL
jgi:hypothetical protein